MEELMSIGQILSKLGSSDQVQVYQAKMALSRLVALAGGNRAGGAGQAFEKANDALGGGGNLAQDLAAALTGKPRENKATGKQAKAKQAKAAPPENAVPAKVRNEVCRALAYVATEKEVGALVSALEDLEVRDMARWALDRIPGAAATKALIEIAANGVGNEFRIGAVNSLGKRTGAEVLTALAKLATDEVSTVRLAAADALAHQADASADSALAEIASHEKNHAGAVRAITKARIRLGESLARAGKKNDAIKVFRSVLTGNLEPAQKKAAERALQSLS